MEHSSRWVGKMLFGFDPTNCTEHFVRRHRDKPTMLFGCQRSMCTEHGLGLDNAPNVFRCIVVEAVEVEERVRRCRRRCPSGCPAVADGRRLCVLKGPLTCGDAGWGLLGVPGGGIPIGVDDAVIMVCARGLCWPECLHADAPPVAVSWSRTSGSSRGKRECVRAEGCGAAGGWDNSTRKA
jgi:hypothetical protein